MICLSISLSSGINDSTYTCINLGILLLILIQCSDCKPRPIKNPDDLGEDLYYTHDPEEAWCLDERDYIISLLLGGRIRGWVRYGILSTRSSCPAKQPEGVLIRPTLISSSQARSTF